MMGLTVLIKVLMTFTVDCFTGEHQDSLRSERIADSFQVNQPLSDM